MTNILAFALLLPQALPFGTVLVLPRGAQGSYTVQVENANRFGEFAHSADGRFAPVADGTVQFLPEGDRGWHGATLWTDSAGRLVRTSLDPSKSQLDAVWYPGGVPRPGWVRTMPGRAMGAWMGFVWPKEHALRVECDGGRFFFSSKGSPSMCLEVVGDGNDVTVDVEQGQQSNNIQDLAAVRVVGKGNTVRGVARGQMCALFVNGPENRALDMALVVEGIGDDVGALYVKAGSDGFRATNVTAWMPQRRYPSRHGTNGFYIDDRSSGAVLYNCAAYGPFDRGAFFHGGSDNRVERFRSLGPARAVVFAPHFTTPTVQPTGNVERSTVRG